MISGILESSRHSKFLHLNEQFLSENLGKKGKTQRLQLTLSTVLDKLNYIRLLNTETLKMRNPKKN